MLIKHKIGNLASFDLYQRIIDFVNLEWYETNKRILHKKSKSGKEIVMKFMSEAPELTDGDILWQDETSVIAVEIQPCESIIVRPDSMYQMASLCYEIGNKHLPLFYINKEILVPYDEPLFTLLSAAQYQPQKAIRKLLNPLKTTVSPHGVSESKQSLFSKILQLTTSSADV